MGRTVKAWAVVGREEPALIADHGVLLNPHPLATYRTKDDAYTCLSGADLRVVPIVITYNDATPRKSARARAGGKRRRFK